MREIHGDTDTRLHNILKGMKNRCRAKQYEKTYKNIEVCTEWKNSYLAFKSWALSNNYNENSSIDRKNNNDNYCPDNCRWTNQIVQSSNTRILYSHNKSGYRGVSWNKKYSKWEVSISVKSKVIKVGYYDCIKEAAQAYDTYVRDNNLPHTTNNTAKRTESNTGKLLLTTNTSGYIGVSRPKRIRHLKNSWVAQISIKKKKIFSGYFKTALIAAIRREEFIIATGSSSKRNFSDKDLEQHIEEFSDA